MTLLDHLAVWQGRDQAPLKHAVAPPVDWLDDTYHDVVLAVVFRDLAAVSSATARITRIHAAIAAHEPMVRYARDRGAEDVATRIERMLTVLNVWAAEISSFAELRVA